MDETNELKPTGIFVLHCKGCHEPDHMEVGYTPDDGKLRVRCGKCELALLSVEMKEIPQGLKEALF